ncbi:MAG: hypothetical protein JOY61_04285, partial [Chloroflexi bacterium]|nr:hypothetical protein [Chloroflexota bacterium]
MPRARPTAAVLHGGWIVASDEAPAGFAIWGEQSPNARVRPRQGRKRNAAPPATRPHPFALSDDGVRHALSIMGLTRWAVQTNVRKAFACLPSRGDEPLRSSELLQAASAADVRLAEWELSAVVLDEVSSVSLLPRIAAASAPNSSMLGDDLRAWIVAARFALSLLVRQRFLPRVVQLGEDEDELVARWAPVMDDVADRATLQAIEAGMPTAGTSLTWAPDEPRATPRDALADYLAAVIDGVARRSRPSAGDTTHLPAIVSAWLASLGRDDATIQLQGDASRTLRRNVTAWTDQTGGVEADAAFRLC